MPFNICIGFVTSIEVLIILWIEHRKKSFLVSSSDISMKKHSTGFAPVQQGRKSKAKATHYLPLDTTISSN